MKNPGYLLHVCQWSYHAPSNQPKFEGIIWFSLPLSSHSVHQRVILLFQMFQLSFLFPVKSPSTNSDTTSTLEHSLLLGFPSSVSQPSNLLLRAQIIIMVFKPLTLHMSVFYWETTSHLIFGTTPSSTFWPSFQSPLFALLCRLCFHCLLMRCMHTMVGLCFFSDSRTQNGHCCLTALTLLFLLQNVISHCFSKSLLIFSLR